MKVFEFYGLECLYDYRACFAVYSLPNYGGGYYLSAVQKMEVLLRINFNLSGGVYLCLEIFETGRSIDLGILLK